MKPEHTAQPDSDVREGASPEAEPRPTYDKPTLENLGDWGIFNQIAPVSGGPPPI